MSNSDFKQLQAKALFIKKKYGQKQDAKGLPAWTASDYMAGFVADVGELSEFIMAKKGIRSIENVDEKIEHELCDCLYSVFSIADELDVDLQTAFDKNMALLAERIEQKGR